MIVVDRRASHDRLLDRLDAQAPHGWGAWLAPLGTLYAAGAALKRGLAPPRPLPPLPPSIGIGNLRVGGAGKTPLVAALGQALQRRGLRVAVVTRGYRARPGHDEPHWLAQQLGGGVVVDADRWRGFQHAAAEGAQVVLLDDALQCAVVPTVLLAVVLDRDRLTRPRPLPAGPAREGQRALERAQALLVRVETDPWPLTPVQRESYARWAARECGGRAFAFRLAPVSLRNPAGQEVALREARQLGGTLLVSGLARPRSFERDAQRAGVLVLGSLRLRDHAIGTARVAADLRALADALGARSLVCPEKNHAGLAGQALPRPLYQLCSAVEWADEDAAERVAAAAGCDLAGTG